MANGDAFLCLSKGENKPCGYEQGKVFQSFHVGLIWTITIELWDNNELMVGFIVEGRPFDGLRDLRLFV
jgi:hypothetical protein